MLASHKSALRKIFKFYSNVEEVVGYGRELRWSDVKKSRAAMSQGEWKKFVQDFHLLPDIMSKVQLAASFREANFGHKSFDSKDETRLSFPEFEDCIARCALRAYGYKIPPSPEEYEMMGGPNSVIFEPVPMRVKVHSPSSKEASRVFREGDGRGSPEPMDVTPKYAVRCTTGYGGPKLEDSPTLYRERSYIYKVGRGAKYEKLG